MKIQEAKRVMIIVWSWQELTNRNPPVDTYPVQETNEDLIIRINQPNSEATLQLITDWIMKLAPEAKIFVFLHRGHGFVDTSIRHLIRMAGRNSRSEDLIKCFLFSGGRDFIYYDTYSIGLLDQFEDFMEDDDYEYFEEGQHGEYCQKSGRVCVFEYNKVLQRNEIIPHYFNVVWQHYEFEYTKKIKELRLDLLSYLTEIPANGQNTASLSAKNWFYKIRSNELLSLRMNSFLGLYNASMMEPLDKENRKKREEELDALKEYEEDAQTSYVFDDCNANISTESAREIYNLINQKFRPIFTANFLDAEQSISLKQIDDYLTRLINEI